MHQHAANRSAEQRSEQTGTPGEEPVNHDEDDAVIRVLRVPHASSRPGTLIRARILTGERAEPSPVSRARARGWSGSAPHPAERTPKGVQPCPERDSKC
jgi:hypothetical protein